MRKKTRLTFNNLRHALFAVLLAGLLVVFLLGVFQGKQYLAPLQYLYLFFILMVVFYGIYPLYAHRRLTRYYWDRVKKHRLAVSGIVFIAFLVVVAVIGPFFTADPTTVNFKDKNTPPLGFSTEQSVYDVSTNEFITTEVTGSTGE